MAIGPLITRTLLAGALAAAALLPLAHGADWPGFRGPTADGIAPDQGINKDWSAKPPQVLWKVALSDNGWAAPAVADGRLYIVDHEGTDDIVRALDAASGKELWRFAYPDATTNRNGFTVNTPLAVDGKVYVYSRKGKIHCLDAASGKKVWSRDLAAEHPGAVPPWEFCMSPVADGPALLLGVSGTADSVMALQKGTGETLWQAGAFQISYASPVVATLGGKKQYLVFGVEGLFGLDPAGGKELWRVPWPTKFGGKKGPTPVLLGNDRVFAATTEGGDTGVVDLASGTPAVVWKHKEMQDHFPTAVYYQGRLYGPSDPKFLECLDPATGAVLWKQETGQYTSVLGVDGTVIALSGKTGELIQIDATTPDYKELGRCTPLGGTSWAAPVLANGRLYVRNQKELACVGLK
ncbi:MAG: PQQ-binding-like beta-propeller repeat protein [Chthoniobacteraceae bacterium]|nr:PQQ-binding-like beta-propeller repeat protein [Chthoniobacteraceae bacterium]